MVHAAGCCGLRWDQVYRKAHREECMDALTASVEREANIRHGGNGTNVAQGDVQSQIQTTWLRVLQGSPCLCVALLTGFKF